MTKRYTFIVEDCRDCPQFEKHWDLFKHYKGCRLLGLYRTGDVEVTINDLLMPNCPLEDVE